MKNKENAITLIALIITIIVMLILVGVTINVALNGGLFEKAKNAANGTQKQAEKEELMSAAFGTVDTNGNLQITKTTLEGVLSQDWEIDDEDTITDSNNQMWYTCTSPKGNIYYLNTTTGKIIETEPTQTNNVWKERGLTSSNVAFDKVYHMESDGDNIILYSNGSYIWDEDITDPDNITPSSYVQDGIESNPELYIIGSNYILIQTDIISSYFAFVYENNGVLNVYDARINDADFELSSIIANDTDGVDEFVLVNE